MHVLLPATSMAPSANSQQALKYDPKHPGALMNLGIIEWKAKKDVPDAVAAWQKLLKLNPDFPQKDQVERLIAEASRAARVSRAHSNRNVRVSIANSRGHARAGRRQRSGYCSDFSQLARLGCPSSDCDPGANSAAGRSRVVSARSSTSDTQPSSRSPARCMVVPRIATTCSSLRRSFRRG